MITYIDKNKVEEYSKLVEAANVLGITADSLDTETYIRNLGRLSEVSTKYVRLPIDEDVFEVNADTRVISTKNSFGKNGVGVVGDELAEILYFRMARYFEATDFASSDLDIYIQWENAAGEQGVSKAYALDKDSEKEFIYFGWALSSKITAKAGTVKFNIRIIKRETAVNGSGTMVPVISYSFSTQVAQVSVKSGLNLDLLSEDLYVDEVNDLVTKNMMGVSLAKNVKILSNLPEVANVGTQLSLSIDTSELDPSDVVAYQWYKDGKLYLTDSNGAEVEYFKPALTITETGDYYLVVLVSKEIVDTRVKTEDGNEVKFGYHTSISNTQSLVCSVPKPIKLNIIKDLAPSLLLGNSLDMEINYQNDINSITLNIGKTASVKNGLDLATAEFADVPVTRDNYSITVVDSEKKVAKVSYTPSEAGYYKLKVTNSLNGDVVPGDWSSPCRATSAAVAPEVELKANSNRKTLPIGTTLTAKVKNLTEENSDDRTYAWFKVVTDEEGGDEAIKGATEESYKTTALGSYYCVVGNKFNGTSAETSTEETAIVIAAEK